MDATDERIVFVSGWGNWQAGSLPEETRQPRKSNKYRFTAGSGRYDDSGGGVPMSVRVDVGVEG